MGIAVINSHHLLRGSDPQPNLASSLTLSKPHSRVAKLLMVQGSAQNVAAIEAALSGVGHELSYASSWDAALAILAHPFAVDLIFLDLSSSGNRALEFCRLLKKNQATQLLPVYAIGSADDQDEEIRAIEAGVDEFLVHPLRPRALQARIQATLRHQAMIDSLDDSEAVLFSLAQSVEDRDPELGQHCHRLALMGAAMGLTLGLSSPEILALQRGGYLHDIGKVAVPDHVLFKAGPLSPEEWETMKSHAERGARICGGIKSLRLVLPIIRHHHERWDGSGYPNQLRGEEIPLLARILQLADIYDALTTARPYKEAMTPEQALATIREEVKRGWRDPKLVEMFADVLPTFRTAPAATDHSHFSLHALAASVDRFRKDAGQTRSKLEQIRSSREFRLVSGF